MIKVGKNIEIIVTGRQAVQYIVTISRSRANALN